MSTRDDGGPAFPILEHVPLWGGGSKINLSGGMSLRDYFAGQALIGLEVGRAVPMGPDEIARLAYEYADAMLVTRASTPSED